MSQSIAEMLITLIFKWSGDSEKNALSKAKQLKSSLTKILSTIGISISLVGIKNLLEEWNSVNKVVNNLNTNLEDQYAVQNDILEAANNCRLAYSDMANYVNNLIKSGSSFFSTAEDAADFLELTNQLYQVSGATSSEISSLNSVMTTTFSTGKLSASGFSTILSSCPEIVDYLADSLGMSTQNVKALGYAGMITAKQLYTALTGAADEISDAYSDLSLTISDAITIIKNKWGTWLSQLDQTYQITDRIANLMITAFDAVLGVLEKLAVAFDKLAEFLGSDEAALKAVAAALIALIAAFNTTKITGIFTSLKNFGTIFTNLGSKISAFIGALKSGTSIAQAFTSVFTNWKIMLVVAAIVAVVAVVRDLIKLLNGEDSTIGNLFEKLGIDSEAFKDSLQGLIDTFKGLFNAILPVLQNLVDTLLPAIKNIINSIVGVISNLVQIVVNVLEEVFDLVSTIVTALTPAISTLLTILDPICDVLVLLADLVAEVVDAIAGLIEPIGLVISVLVELLTDILEPIIEVLGFLIDVVAGRLSDAFEFVGKIIDGVVNGTLKPMVEFLKYVIQFIKAVFTGDWEDVWKALGNVVIAIINGVIASFESLLNMCIAGINSITSALSSLWSWAGIPEIPEISDVSFSRIAYLAEGGYVEANNPTPVVIGDNTQEGEIVSPISKMRDTVLDALRIYALANSSENDTYNDSTDEIVQIGNSLLSALLQLKTAVSSALPYGEYETYNTTNIDTNVTNSTVDVSSVVTALLQIVVILQNIATSFAMISVGDDYDRSVTLASNDVQAIVSDLVSYLSSSMNFSGSQTAAQTLESQVSTTNISQNVYMYNTFEGTKEVQKTTSAAMKSSATDLTEALANAIKYTR